MVMVVLIIVNRSFSFTITTSDSTITVVSGQSPRASFLSLQLSQHAYRISTWLTRHAINDPWEDLLPSAS